MTLDELLDSLKMAPQFETHTPLGRIIMIEKRRGQAKKAFPIILDLHRTLAKKADTLLEESQAVRTSSIELTRINNGLAELNATLRLIPGALASFGNEAVPLLIETLDDKDSSLQDLSVKALGSIGPDAREATPELLRLLKDDNEYLRLSAVRSLWLINKNTDGILPTVVDALKRKDKPRLQQTAAGVVEEIGPKAQQAVPVLVEVLKDSKLRSRYLPADAAILLDESATAKLWEPYNLSVDVLRAIGSIGPEAREALPEITGCLPGPSPDWLANRVYEAACEALGDIGPAARSAAPVLARIKEGNDPSLAAVAARALKKIEGQANDKKTLKD